MINDTQLALFDLPSQEVPLELSELDKDVLEIFKTLSFRPQKALTIWEKLDADKWGYIVPSDVTQALTKLTPNYLEKVGDCWKLK